MRAMIITLCAIFGFAAATSAARTHAPVVADYTADGRTALPELLRGLDALAQSEGWVPETIFAYPGTAATAIKSWRTPHRGEALWILSGIHGEEPAGPNAIARSLPSLVCPREDRRTRRRDSAVQSDPIISFAILDFDISLPAKIFSVD